jgi:hypothetical protein
MSETGDLIRGAKALIANEKQWIKKALRVVRDGTPCYCLYGALHMTVFGLVNAHRSNSHKDVIRWVRVRGLVFSVVKKRGADHIEAFNDDDDTTHADVMDVCDEAAKLADEEAA